jgi:ABC-2 type transport system ATP-binding protein
MAAVIRVRGLCKRYGDLAAVDGLDLDVAACEVFALLGPNGAGKTTTVEILEGYRSRSAGDVSVLGRDPERADGDWRARIGIVLQSTGWHEELTVAEVVTHFAGFYPRPRPPEEVIALVGLEHKRHARAGTLSGGQRRRLDVALGLVGDPDLIFLDEPTTGFDPAARHQAWSVITDLRALGKTVLLTTHYLDEAEHLADRVGVIAAGKLLAVAPPSLLGGRATASARVRFRAAGRLRGCALPELPGAEVSVAGGEVTVRTDHPTAAIRALGAWAAAAGVDELPELSVLRPTLEEVYLEMVGSTEATGA